MTTPHDKALEAFTDYFVRNYPGPDTVIFDPKWHAPKLFNAAIKAIEASGGIVCAREPAGYVTEVELAQLKFGVSSVDLFGSVAPKDFRLVPLHAPLSAWQRDDGWNRDMNAAPKDKTPVIIAVLHKDNDAYIVGEAYFDPEHYGDGDWWWAGNSHGDYHGGPISDINYHGPSAWRPLPAPPSLQSDTEGAIHD